MIAANIDKVKTEKIPLEQKREVLDLATKMIEACRYAPLDMVSSGTYGVTLNYSLRF